MSEILHLEKQKFVGPKYSAEQYKVIEDFQESPERRAEVQAYIGEELPIPEQQVALIKTILEATSQYFLNELKTDISARLPDISHFHLLSKERFEALRDNPNDHIAGMEILGFIVDHNDIVLKQSDQTDLQMHIVQHELIHTIAQRLLTFKVTEDSGELRTARRGFSIQKNFWILEEFLTEYTAQDIVKNYWPAFEGLRDLQPFLDGHENAMKVGKTLMQRVAREFAIDEHDLMGAFQRAQLTGNMKILRLIDRTWGREVMRDLVKSDVSLEAGRLATKLAGIAGATASPPTP